MSHCLTYSIIRQLRKKNVPLLDLHGGATVAYSLRKLSSDYTGYCVKVRRSSDDSLQDIGFNSHGGINKTELLSFVGSGNGFIDTWYDQSSSGINISQSVLLDQPQIVMNGLVILRNGNPAVYFNGTNYNLKAASNYSLSTFISSEYKTSSLAVITDEGGTSAANTIYFLGNARTQRMVLHASFGNVIYYDAGNDSTRRSTVNVSDVTALTREWFNNQKMIFCYSNGLLQYITIDGVQVGIKNVSGTPGLSLSGYFSVGCYREYNLPNMNLYNHKGSIQELIIYNDDMSADTNGLKSNINTFYDI